MLPPVFAVAHAVLGHDALCDPFKLFHYKDYKIIPIFIQKKNQNALVRRID